MEPNGNIRCTNYTCGYEGPLTGKDGKGAEFTDPMTGETIDSVSYTHLRAHET